MISVFKITAKVKRKIELLYFFSYFRVVNRTFATTKGQKYQKSTV